jgi:hypothetical protein
MEHPTVNSDETGSPQTASAREGWQPELGQDYETGMARARENRRQRASDAATAAVAIAREYRSPWLLRYKFPQLPLLPPKSAPADPPPPRPDRTGEEIMDAVRKSWRRQFPDDPPGAY